MPVSNEVRFANLVSVDNTLGVSLNLAGETDVQKKVTLKDSFIFGETSDLAKDCPDGLTGKTGADCYCPEKFGFMNSVFLRNKKSPHLPEASPRPVYKAKSYHTWNGKVSIENMNFINFKAATSCNSK